MRQARISTGRRQPGRRSTNGLSLTGTATLAAVVSVLILVSLPRLRGFALRANERDALSAARLLANTIAKVDATKNGGRVTIEHLLEVDGVRRRLLDAELLAGGRLLRYHGYLFDLIDVAPGELPPAAERLVHAGLDEHVPIVRAWPWLYGQTGTAALLARPGGIIFAHGNDGPVWSGPGQPPEPGADWHAVR